MSEGGARVNVSRIRAHLMGPLDGFRYRPLFCSASVQQSRFRMASRNERSHPSARRSAMNAKRLITAAGAALVLTAALLPATASAHDRRGYYGPPQGYGYGYGNPGFGHGHKALEARILCLPAPRDRSRPGLCGALSRFRPGAGLCAPRPRRTSRRSETTSPSSGARAGDPTRVSAARQRGTVAPPVRNPDPS